MKRHHYGNELWYVIQDQLTGKCHRFTPEAYQIIGRMDGHSSIQEIWIKSCNKLKDQSIVQDEVISLLGQLHQCDLLQAEIPPDSEELFDRIKNQQNMFVKQFVRSPLSFRIPLLDPDRYLEKLLPFAKPFFGRMGMAMWLAIIMVAIFMAAQHWSELSHNITDRILTPHSLIMLWLTFPFVKVLHELGHAMAIKRWGGEVHEIGIMFLVFTPIPYVDASAASAFREKRKRLVVGGAGMIVELFIAAFMLLAWLNFEPGYIRAIAYNVILIAGVSTLVFNGNPLLRYDGYYMLMDLVEIPNFSTRCSSYLLYLFRRYILRLKKVQVPFSTTRERIWFVIYAPLSFAYRIWVYTAIILLVASKFFFVGVLIALWGLYSMLVLPSIKGIKSLIQNVEVQQKRFQMVLVFFVAGVLISTLFFAVPFPMHTKAQGVVWIPEKSTIRSGTAGFIQRFAITEGSIVKQGDSLIVCHDPFVPLEVKVLRSKLEELQAVYDSEILTDRVKAEMAAEEIRSVKERLNLALEKESELVIHSPADGLFILPNADDLVGSFVDKGKLLGYVVDQSEVFIRLLISQNSIDLVRNHASQVEVRLAGRLFAPLKAVIKRGAPAATNRLPSAVLSKQGGGDIEVDPTDRSGLKSYQKYYDFELEMLQPLDDAYIGTRVYVRFQHASEPLGYRCLRGLRRLFLRKFAI